jgi:predicted RND superfamily exporter protein
MERLSPNFVYRPLPGFGLAAIRRTVRGSARLVRIISVVAIGGLLAAAFSLKFEGELKNLQPKHSEAFLTQEKIERHLSLSPKQMLVAVEGKDLADVMSRGGRVDLLAERYRKQGEIVAFSSLGQLVNDAMLQKELASRISGKLGNRDVGRDLTLALERHGFDPGAFQGAITALSGLGKDTGSTSADAMARLSASPLRGAVDRHLIHDADGYHLLSYIHYNGAEFHQNAFLKELAAIDPSGRATSVDLVGRQLSEDVRHSFAWGFAIGGVLVLFLLLSHFSSLTGLWATLYPVLAGVVAMLGIMAVSGMRINFMNAMVLVTILGMGSDYGLHVAHRENGVVEEEGRSEAFVQSGRAVLLSALTTIAGFGSLAFADYGALASIGWATNFGIGATALFTLVSLPAFFRK